MDFRLGARPFAPVERFRGEVDHEFVCRARGSPGGILDPIPLFREYAVVPDLRSIGRFGQGIYRASDRGETDRRA